MKIVPRLLYGDGGHGLHSWINNIAVDENVPVGVCWFSTEQSFTFVWDLIGRGSAARQTDCCFRFQDRELRGLFHLRSDNGTFAATKFDGGPQRIAMKHDGKP